jgi:hypothetical protein
MAALCVPSCLPAQDSSQIAVKDQGEIDAFVKAFSQSDPRAKTVALEGFLRTYPDTKNKGVALNILMNTYESLKDDRDALSAAKRGLQVDPNDHNFIFVAVKIEIDECNRTGDAKTCNDAAGLGQRGLTIPKPPDYTDDNWRTTTHVTYPFYRSAIALARPEPPDSPKMTNNEVIQLVAAGLSDQVVTTSIRQASNRSFDLTIAGLIALKKAKVSDAVMAAMQDSETPAQTTQTNESAQLPAAQPPAPTPDNGCSDIDFMGVSQIQGSLTGGLWIYVATIRNRATYAKEVDLEYVKNGAPASGTFNVGPGQKINARLDVNNNPPTDVHLTACR